MERDSSSASCQQPKGQFLITMSNKQNEVVKFISDEQRIKCEKIITLSTNRDGELLRQYLSQLQRIQDYLQRIHQLPSHLRTWENLQLYRKYTNGRVVLKIVTRFWQYPTLEDYLRKEAIRPQEKIQRNGRTLLHFFVEFMQLLARAGGIDFYFYTPRNIFLIMPEKDEHLHPFGKVVLNFTSLAGIKLLVGNNRIIREDFCQIYPLLPPDFFHLRQRKKWPLLDSIIKKRALGFLIICFIICKVPELIDPKMLDTLVQEDTIKQRLDKSVYIFQKVFKVFGNLFEDAQRETGIKLIQMLRRIFVDPYAQQAKIKEKNKRGIISWEEIYVYLFQSNKYAKKEWEVINADSQLKTANKYFHKMLLNMWSLQPHKQYYWERDFVVELEEGKEQQSMMMYFLTKINCNFHKLLKYHDACQLILRQRFSEDATQVVFKLIRIFTAEPEQAKKQYTLEKQNVNPSESLSNALSQLQELGMDRTSGDASLRLFNPFSIHNSQQMEQIQNGLSPSVQDNSSSFMNKLKSIPQFLSSVSSFEYKESKKSMVSLSQKQVILSEFCASLWPS